MATTEDNRWPHVRTQTWPLTPVLPVISHARVVLVEKPGKALGQVCRGEVGRNPGPGGATDGVPVAMYSITSIFVSSSATSRTSETHHVQQSRYPCRSLFSADPRPRRARDTSVRSAAAKERNSTAHPPKNHTWLRSPTSRRHRTGDQGCSAGPTAARYGAVVFDDVVGAAVDALSARRERHGEISAGVGRQRRTG